MKNFVKFPNIVFSKARLHNWAKRKYITSENKAQDRVDASFYKYATLYATGKEWQAQLVDKFYHFDPVSNTLYNLIKNFTYKELDKVTIENLINTLLVAGIRAEIVNDTLHIESEELSFDVDKFSFLEPDILRRLPNIELPTRGGRSHPYGVVTTMFYGKYADIETCLVTGRIYQLSPSAKYLHSWVEIAFDGRVYVIDPTRNSVMPKEAFYHINHVGEIVKLHSSIVKKDYKMIRSLTDYDNYAVKVYYENPERGRALYKKLVDMGEIQENEKTTKISLL